MAWPSLPQAGNTQGQSPSRRASCPRSSATAKGDSGTWLGLPFFDRSTISQLPRPQVSPAIPLRASRGVEGQRGPTPGTGTFAARQKQLKELK